MSTVVSGCHDGRHCLKSSLPISLQPRTPPPAHLHGTSVRVSGSSAVFRSTVATTGVPMLAEISGTIDSPTDLYLRGGRGRGKEEGGMGRGKMEGEGGWREEVEGLRI